MRRAPELLLPAGNLAKLNTAFDFGADAVYAGLPRYSLRARNNDFRLEQLAQGIESAHARGKQLFVAANVLPHNAKVNTFLADMAPVIAMKPDALIMADPGLIMLVREAWPQMPIHLSVQANTVNYAGVKFWQTLGLTRVILSRELGLEEIAQIRQQCPDMELEVFVHGALCIAYSGRCLLSGYFNHRDPNQGTCTNACRWDYKVHSAGESACGGVPRHDAGQTEYLLEEANRPGELMPIVEDEHGTYIMNSKDLRAVEHVARLVEIGVDSLKVEGRTKSAYYVARTAQVYRKAIDDAVAGKAFDPALLADLEGLANRGYTDGFLQRHHSHDTQNYLDGHSRARQSQYVGEVLNVVDGWARIDVKNRIAVGDKLEIIHPCGNQVIELQAMIDGDGQPVTVAAGNGVAVSIALPATLDKALIARLL
ncbi:prephenate-dependent tRNA uridine(34) hydroxylase TrhP [Silvimonas iriomotensis]|uniref:U32 family peptidase n=1 Tax=Silvimonas iriomotensis TaxID=449662 RepID=A0ABQ2PDL5_9NEIS|nr:tRNA 5-hydroxyuridine modification protein YegQ [Silvimonas iriomotensis]GGP23356.1 U32 family peptidase [Silvimonas iriomotensis]